MAHPPGWAFLLANRRADRLRRKMPPIRPSDSRATQNPSWFRPIKNSVIASLRTSGSGRGGSFVCCAMIVAVPKDGCSAGAQSESFETCRPMGTIVVASSPMPHQSDVRWWRLRIWLAAHIELKNAWNHNDGLWPIAVFKHCELECFGAINEKSATNALLVLNDPISPTVFSDHEERNSRTRFGGGRLDMFHDTSPSK